MAFFQKYLITLLLIAPSYLMAQRYKVQCFAAKRIEVNSLFDAEITSADHQLLAPYTQKIAEVATQVVGHSGVEMGIGRPESPLSNLVADVMLEAAATKGGADLAIMNIGAIRSGLPSGEITYGMLLDMLPYDNRLYLMEVKGADLYTLFSQIALLGGEGIAGAQLVITPSRGLKSATVGGKSIEDEASYRIVTIDYLAEGNGRLGAFRKGVVLGQLEPTLRDLLVDYIGRVAAENGVIEAKMEGRITVDCQ